MQVMSSSSAVISPSSIASDVAMLMDVDMLSDIECGQPESDSFFDSFADNVFADSDDDREPVLTLLPNNDRAYVYKAKVQESVDGVVPDYHYAHSSVRMFGKRGSSFRYPGFEFWRRNFGMCRFHIIVLADNDYNQWVDDDVLTDRSLDMRYICPHENRLPLASERCRVRPACCDRYNRSCCWVDLSLTFHGVHGISSCVAVGANAPNPSFNVDSASLHPITRTREYFHCGASFGYPVAECKQIDNLAIDELSIAFCMLRIFAMQLPVVWCEIMRMFNPYEKMIFASMMYDGNAIDDFGHQLRCNRLYGFNLSAHEYSIFHGSTQPLVHSTDELRVMMNRRHNSPCQQLMRYGGAYDLTNMLNRQAIRVEIVAEWRYKLFDMGRILLYRLEFYYPDHELCWSVCSYDEKTRYIDTWRSVLRYLKVMTFPIDTNDKQTFAFMLTELDDVIRSFVDSHGLFSYLMSCMVRHHASCADLHDIGQMTWDKGSDVKTLVNLDNWNSGFRTLVCQTLMHLELDMDALGDMVEIAIHNTHIGSDEPMSPFRINWRNSLARVVKPIIKLFQTI